MKCYYNIACILGFLLLCGCQSAPSTVANAPAATDIGAKTADDVVFQPIDLGLAGSKPIQFRGAVVSMDVGTPFGTITGGWLNVNLGMFRVTPNTGRELLVAGQEELEKEHYTLTNRSDQLFEKASPEVALLQLGARITSMHLDVHVQGGWAHVTLHCHGTMTVDWQLFDGRTNSVVFDKVISVRLDEAQRDDNVSPIPLSMFKRSLRGLMADQDFVKLVRNTNPNRHLGGDSTKPSGGPAQTM